MKRVLSYVVFSVIVLTFTIAYAGYKRIPGYKIESKHTARGVGVAMELIKMRSRLAIGNIKENTKVTGDTVLNTCLTVSEWARRFTVENDIYKIRFVSKKFRNPKNAPNPVRSENIWLRQIEKQGLTEKRYDGPFDGENYHFYMKPIFAEKACLACHGEAEGVPKFIKQKYPNDRSFDFEEGDMMGAVVVYTWKGNEDK